VFKKGTLGDLRDQVAALQFELENVLQMDGQTSRPALLGQLKGVI